MHFALALFPAAIIVLALHRSVLTHSLPLSSHRYFFSLLCAHLAPCCSTLTTTRRVQFYFCSLTAVVRRPSTTLSPPHMPRSAVPQCVPSLAPPTHTQRECVCSWALSDLYFAPPSAQSADALPPLLDGLRSARISV